MESIIIDAELRTEISKSQTKALRKEGKVPCIFYGTESGNVHFAAHENAFKDLIYTNKFHTATIKVDGKELKAIIQDVQFDPVTDAILHIDFLELVAGKKIKAELPVNLVGNAKGVKEGGVLTLKRRKLKVQAYPKDLQEKIEVNVDALGLGDSLKIGDVEVENMEFVDPPRITVVNVAIPRALKNAEAEEAAAEGEEAEGGEAPAAAEGGEAPKAEAPAETPAE